VTDERLDFAVNRSKVKVTTRPNVVKNDLFKMQLSGKGILVSCLLSKTVQYLGISYYRMTKYDSCSIGATLVT